ncbi:MAG: redoxin domain-containing protein [Clostridiales bacterium]|jgi:peroxiredoxin|nr:redoxin domain-containing protein [Clostridiales bacterium]
MAKLSAGDMFPDARVLTHSGEERSVRELVSKSGKTAFVFLRYYGCSLSQYDVEAYANNYELITSGGNSLVVVLQSTPESIKKQCPFDIPFDIICDEKAVLYKQLGIEAVSDMKDAFGKLTEFKIKYLRSATDIKHGDYEGIEEQLPACFIVDSGLKILKAHYAAEIGDVPSPEDFQGLFA